MHVAVYIVQNANMSIVQKANMSIVPNANMSIHFSSLRGRKKQLCCRSKHIQCSKERYLLGQNKLKQIFGVIPFVKLQNDT